MTIRTQDNLGLEWLMNVCLLLADNPILTHTFPTTPNTSQHAPML